MRASGRCLRVLDFLLLLEWTDSITNAVLPQNSAGPGRKRPALMLPYFFVASARSCKIALLRGVPAERCLSRCGTGAVRPVNHLKRQFALRSDVGSH